MSLLHPHPFTRVRETDGGLVVELPSPRRPVAVVLLAGWLAAWVVGLGFVSQQVLAADRLDADVLFVAAWAVLWIAAGVLATLHLAWLLAGRETLTLGHGELRIHRGIWGLGLTHRYALAEVSELRTFGREVAPALAAGLELAGRGASGARFRHRGRVVRFARALDEAAAHVLVEALRAHAHFPGSDGHSHQPAA